MGSLACVNPHRSRQPLAHEDLVDRLAIGSEGVVEPSPGLIEEVARIFDKPYLSAGQLTIAIECFASARLVERGRLGSEVPEGCTSAIDVSVKRRSVDRPRDRGFDRR